MQFANVFIILFVLRVVCFIVLLSCFLMCFLSVYVVAILLIVMLSFVFGYAFYYLGHLWFSMLYVYACFVCSLQLSVREKLFLKVLDRCLFVVCVVSLGCVCWFVF